MDYSRENFHHELNCPVLIAQDVLTNNIIRKDKI